MTENGDTANGSAECARPHFDDKLWFGTSSWSEKSWVGGFYSSGIKPTAMLTHYATQFPCVEADVTYYRIPDDKLVDGWNARTPDGFRLCAKFPRSIVHAGEGPRPNPDRVLVPAEVDADCTEFLTAMQRLGPKCGPLVLQFPYFNRSAFPSARPFLDRLDTFLARLPRELRYAVEIRNKAWIGPPLFEVLRAHGAAFVHVDIGYLPHPEYLAGKHDLLTGDDFVYARLIGDRKATEKAAERFDRVVLDQGDRLRRWAELIRRYLDRVAEVFVFANNHYAGFGPGTIRELVERIDRETA